MILDRLAILIPVFDDWDSLATLLSAVDRVLLATGITGLVTIVDDGSTQPIPIELAKCRYAALRRVELLRLRCNVGHQRAIAVGLAHLNRVGVRAESVAVMDGDGEDRPEDIPTLVSEWQRGEGRLTVVFAARKKRLEGFAFRALYQCYRLVHWSLTGVSVRVGNFSVVSAAILPRLLSAPEMWNHFAATVFRSRLPFSTVPVARGRRYGGRSHMNYSALVAHGLSAISVFSDIVGARLLLYFTALLAVVAVCVVTVLMIRFTTSYAIPGWATNAVGLLVVIALQVMVSLIVLALVVLGDRSSARVIPLRDADWYIESVRVLFEAS